MATSVYRLADHLPPEQRQAWIETRVSESSRLPPDNSLSARALSAPTGNLTEQSSSDSSDEDEDEDEEVTEATDEEASDEEASHSDDEKIDAESVDSDGRRA
jgi:hypothetical protein